MVDIPRKRWSQVEQRKLASLLEGEGIPTNISDRFARALARFFEQFTIDEEENYLAIERWANNLDLGGEHPNLAEHDSLGLATQSELDGHTGATDPHNILPIGTADIADAAVTLAKLNFDVATQSELDSHIGSPHNQHPDLTAHNTLGLATQSELDGHGHALGDLSNVTATGEGSGGGFDADTVDGKHASAFVEGSRVSQNNSPSTIVERNSEGDIRVRLLRSEYTSLTPTPNYLLAQHAVGTGDNYARPSSLAQVKSAMGMAEGRLGHATKTAHSFDITTRTTILSLTVNVPANRILKVSYQTEIHPGSGSAFVELLHGSTQISRFRWDPPYHASLGARFAIFQLPTGSSGNQTFNLVIDPRSTDNIDVLAPSDNPTYILVEDIGPA